MTESSEKSITVLCVDDEPGMADLIGTYLERVEESITARSVTTSSEALTVFETTQIDCIVSDYDMPEQNGLALLDEIRSRCESVPFILFTGRGSEEIASEAITRGVTDYMQKCGDTDQYAVLAKRIMNVVDRSRLTTRVKSATTQAETLLQESPNGVIVTVDTECVYVNPAAVTLLTGRSNNTDCDAADLVHTPITQYLPDITVPTAPTSTASHTTPNTATTLHDRIPELDGTRFKLKRINGATATVDVKTREITWEGQSAVMFIIEDVTERHLYEEEMRYKQALLDSVFDMSPDGVLLTTRDGDVLTYNDQFWTLWGIPETDVADAAKSVFDAQQSRVTDPDAFRESIRAQNTSDTASKTMLELQDGTVLEQYATPVELDGKHETVYIWYYRDMTAVHQLQSAEDTAFRRMTDAVYSLNNAFEFTFINDQSETLLQTDRETLLGENIWEAFPEARGTIVEETSTTALENGSVEQFELYYDPLEKRVEGRVFPSDDGVTVYLRDITEEWQSQNDLERAVSVFSQMYQITANSGMEFEEKQQSLLNLGVEYLDLEYGFITKLTPTTQTIQASTSTDPSLTPGSSCPLENSYCRKTITTDAGFLAISNAIEAGWEDDPAYEEFGLGAYIGGRVFVDGDIQATVCFGDSDPRSEFSQMEQTFVELLSRWLTYEKEQQKHRRELQRKNTELDEFASVVSHDLRNPLSVAKGHLELLREESDSESIDTIDDALTRMNTLIDDVLALSKAGEQISNAEQISLTHVANASWELVDTHDAVLTVPCDCTVLADESRLQQVLENLFRNSVTHGGSDVTITVGCTETGFFIEDTGTGLGDTDIDALFERGYTTTSEGTGIGLRTVKKIADAHNWTVTATTAEHGGARFEFTVPETHLEHTDSCNGHT